MWVSAQRPLNWNVLTVDAAHAERIAAAAFGVGARQQKAGASSP